MKIKTILSQNRRDFTATLECEHCSHEQKLSSGYDDDNFPKNVIPTITCKKCSNVAPESYRSLTTKYPKDAVV